MVKTFKIYHIICEGASEEAYLKELNHYLRESGFAVFFNVYNVCGASQYKTIKNKYREALKRKKNTDEIFIWLDNDVFKRKKLSKDELQKILGDFPGIKYNYENFEDFVVMHLSDEKVQTWHKICIENNHFNNPMTGETLEKLIQSIIPDYSKGDLSQEIQINDESLKRLSENQQNPTIEFVSDFVDVIKQLLKPAS